jgi:hypothetical protein
MIKIISECNDFLKDCGLTYAFCGGYALELFLNKKLRSHSDVDIIVFEENKNCIVDFVLKKNWNVYEHKADWIDNKIANNYLRLIINSNDEKILQLFSVWAIKPDCSFFKIEPKSSEDNTFDYEIVNKEQLNFDFLEIIFNKQKDGKFIVDSFTSQNKDITREPDKAILYNDGIPYLAPEIILFIISHPAYLKSDYHREKNQIDFNSTIPFLPKSSKDWLINALETAYPEGLERLDELKNIN